MKKEDVRRPPFIHSPRRKQRGGVGGWPARSASHALTLRKGGPVRRQGLLARLISAPSPCYDDCLCLAYYLGRLAPSFFLFPLAPSHSHLSLPWWISRQMPESARAITTLEFPWRLRAHISLASGRESRMRRQGSRSRSAPNFTSAAVLRSPTAGALTRSVCAQRLFLHIEAFSPVSLDTRRDIFERGSFEMVGDCELWTFKRGGE